VEQRPLGRLSVSVIGVGGNQFGTTCEQDRVDAVVHAALDHGVTLFDTADEYGEGASEEALAHALGSRRDDVVITTKFGSRLGGDPARGGGSARWIATAVEGSLRRLRTDRIDLYLMHFPDPDVTIDETLAALDGLVQAGKVREVGCCNFTAAQLQAAADAAAAARVGGFACAQDRLNLLRQENLAEVVPTARRLGMAFVPFFPLAAGVLTGKYRPGEAPPAGTRLGDSVPPEQAARMLADKHLSRVEALAAFARDRGHPVNELALAWLLAQPGVPTVIPGATRPEQIVTNTAAARWTLTPDEVAEATRLGRGDRTMEERR
jgi:aryl-alcohol dehydrogenase-like predicted oxidoreductase